MDCAQSKQKETGSVFLFCLICCCLMLVPADVSAPQAGSIFLPNADSSACCYVFCLHSKFPACFSQIIVSLAGPASLLQDTPKSWGLCRSLCTSRGNCLWGSKALSLARDRISAWHPMLMLKYRHNLLGLNTLSFHHPGYQQEEKGHTDRRIYFNLMGYRESQNPSVLLMSEGLPNPGQEINRSDFESQRSSKWYIQEKNVKHSFQTVVQEEHWTHALCSMTSLTSLLGGYGKFSGFQNV